MFELLLVPWCCTDSHEKNGQKKMEEPTTKAKDTITFEPKIMSRPMQDFYDPEPEEKKLPTDFDTKEIDTKFTLKVQL
jgi:hypothetical protein